MMKYAVLLFHFTKFLYYFANLYEFPHNAEHKRSYFDMSQWSSVHSIEVNGAQCWLGIFLCVLKKVILV